MNRALAECIVGCLRVDGSAGLEAPRLPRFAARDWEQALTWLDNSGLGLHFLQSLKDHHAEVLLPAGVFARLERDLAANQQRAPAMAEEFNEINRRFDEAGVRYAVIKGFALIPEYCPDATLRHQLDYDYLIDRSSSPPAQGVLQSMGFTRRTPGAPPNDPPDLLFTRRPVHWPGVTDDFYSASDPRAVELHFDLWQSGEIEIDHEGSGGALHRKVVRSFHDLRFPALSDYDALVFQSFHAFQHMLGYWCRLSCFYEIARYLNARRNDAEFWSGFRDRLRSHLQMAEVVDLVFLMATNLFGGRYSAHDCLGVEGNVAFSLWVERYGMVWALASHPGCKLPLLLYDHLTMEQKHPRRRMGEFLIPRRLPSTVADHSWRLNRANLRKWRYFARRVKFHGEELLCYGLQYPSWQRALRRKLASP